MQVDINFRQQEVFLRSQLDEIGTNSKQEAVEEKVSEDLQNKVYSSNQQGIDDAVDLKNVKIRSGSIKKTIR